RRFYDAACLQNSRIVNENVYGAVPLHDFLHAHLDITGLRNIHPHCMGRRANTDRSDVCRFRIDIGDVDRTTFLDELGANPRSDSTRCAGDEGNLSLQLEVHGFSESVSGYARTISAWLSPDCGAGRVDRDA